ncbi:DUF4468 domain-containing protein [Pedobacter nyackensis]|uniref:DUF4468 domain-containing protein n=1 Tax=Pedobacter nyackensis TaxID=475255 RepID=A0A1W1ZW61_9SPHI|nr:DUF4468 domain-containing protein [Pedobacter nyackensis]SMC52361.1 protein of unknown function [Pedobacter nyackensis]
MKKQLLTLLGIIFTLASFAQKKQKDTAKVAFPIKDGQVFYETIIDSLDGQSKDHVFNTSLKWMAETFIDSKEVIQTKDKESGSIIGTGNFTFTTSGFINTTGTMGFMIEITARENKSRIRLYKFINKYMPSYSIETQLIPMEPAYIKYLNQKQFPKENRTYYLALKDNIESIIKSYKQYLTVNSKKDDF